MIGVRTFLKSGIFLLAFFLAGFFSSSSSSKSSSSSSKSASLRFVVAVAFALLSFLTGIFLGSSSITSSSLLSLGSSSSLAASSFSSSSASSFFSSPNSSVSISDGSFGLLCRVRAVGIFTLPASFKSDSSDVIKTTVFPAWREVLAISLKLTALRKTPAFLGGTRATILFFALFILARISVISSSGSM